MSKTEQVSAKAKAVLFEIAGALERLNEAGESHTILSLIHI